MDKEQEEAIKRSIIRSHRIDQFLWGWLSYAALDAGLKLAGLVTTEAPPGFLLVAFVLCGMAATITGRKVLGTPITFK